MTKNESLKNEALKMALHALERGETVLRWEAIAAIKKALAEPEQALQRMTDNAEELGLYKHVAHIYFLDPSGRPRVGWDDWQDMKVGDKLYRSPPHSKWVDLSWTEKAQAHFKTDSVNDCVNFIQAKLKAKNAA